MMKKLLVLVLVLCVATMANAALISSTQGSLFRMDITGASATVNAGDTLTVQIFAGSDLAVSSMLDTVLNISKAASVGAITQSSAAQWSTYGSSKTAAGAGFNVNVNGTLPADIATGASIYSFTFVTGAAGIVTIDAVSGLWSGSTAVAGPADGYYESGAIYGLPYAQVNVVPEPITVALLGLGGLFIRRRNVA